MCRSYNDAHLNNIVNIDFGYALEFMLLAKIISCANVPFWL